VSENPVGTALAIGGLVLWRRRRLGLSAIVSKKGDLENDRRVIRVPTRFGSYSLSGFPGPLFPPGSRGLGGGVER